MIHKNKTLMSALFLFLLSIAFSQAWADEDDLTADNLAKALGIHWVTIIMPGSENDTYAIGPILEFGDETKDVRGGMFGPIKGGSKLKFIVKKEDGQYNCTIISDGGNISRAELRMPINDVGSTISLGGTRKYGKNLYIVKGSRGNASIERDMALKVNEFGVRLTVKKRN